MPTSKGRALIRVDLRVLIRDASIRDDALMRDGLRVTGLGRGRVRTPTPGSCPAVLSCFWRGVSDGNAHNLQTWFNEICYAK